jgi:hypothetical protein
MQSNVPPPATTAESWIAFFTAILTVFAIVQGCAMIDQLKEMKAQSALQEKQFKLVQEQVAPQIGFLDMDVTPNPFNAKEPLTFTPHFTNTGPTSGRITEIKVGAYPAPPNTKRTEIENRIYTVETDRVYDLVVRPGDTIFQPVNTGTILTEEQVKGIDEKSLRLWVIVQYRFYDVSYDRRYEQKVFVYSRDHRRMELAPYELANKKK